MTSDLTGRTRQQLIEKGRELFIEKGFRKTKVSEITESAGIATGTFYNYFNSKEELFLTIFVKENTKLKEEVVKGVKGEKDPTKVGKQLILELFQGMRSNPILKEYFNQDSFRKIEEKANFDPVGDYAQAAQDLFFPLIENWQKGGKLKNFQPGFVLALFDALFYVYLHQGDIGDEFFPELLEFLIDAIIQGLMNDV